MNCVSEVVWCPNGHENDPAAPHCATKECQLPLTPARYLLSVSFDDDGLSITTGGPEPAADIGFIASTEYVAAQRRRAGAELRAALVARDAERSAAAASALMAIDRGGEGSFSVEWFQKAFEVERHPALTLGSPETTRWVFDLVLWWRVGIGWQFVSEIVATALDDPAVTFPGLEADENVALYDTDMWGGASSGTAAAARNLLAAIARGARFVGLSEDARTLLALCGGHRVRETHWPETLAVRLCWSGERLAGAMTELVAADLAEAPVSLRTAAGEMSLDDLRSVAKRRGLPVSGTRAQLVDRVLAAGHDEDLRAVVDDMRSQRIAVGVAERPKKHLRLVGEAWQNAFYALMGDDFEEGECELTDDELAELQANRDRADAMLRDAASVLLPIEDARGLAPLADGTVAIMVPGELRRVRADGETVWSVPHRDTEWQYLPLVLDDGLLVSEPQALALVDAEFGSDRWRWSHQQDHGALTWQCGTGAAMVVQVCESGLHCIDLTTGDERWFYPLKQLARPTTDGDLVVVMARRKTYHVIDAASGELIRRFSVDEEVRADNEPALYHGRLVLESFPGLIAVDPRTGECAWRTKRGGYGKVLLPDGGLAVGEGVVGPDGRARWWTSARLIRSVHGIVAHNNSGVAAVDPTTGRLGRAVPLAAWSDCQPGPNNSVWTTSSSYVARIDLPLQSKTETLSSASPESPTDAGALVRPSAAVQTLWRRQLSGGCEALAAIASVIIIADHYDVDDPQQDGRHNVHGFAAPDGSHLWAARASVNLVATGQNVAYFGGHDLTALDPGTGETRWEYQPPEQISAMQTYREDAIIVCGTDLVMRIAADGSTLWTSEIDLGNVWPNEFAIVGDQIYIDGIASVDPVSGATTDNVPPKRPYLGNPWQVATIEGGYIQVVDDYSGEPGVTITAVDDHLAPQWEYHIAELGYVQRCAACPGFVALVDQDFDHSLETLTVLGVT